MFRTSLTRPLRRMAGVAAGLILALPVLPARAEPPGALLIHDVRIVDFNGPAPDIRDHASVLISDGQIAQVGDRLTPPPGARIVEGAGRTLMPGLTDMHVHVWDEAELGGYLARGVTTIRNASGMPIHLSMAPRIEAGELIGPRLITTGPILNGPGPNAQINHVLVETPEAARDAVRRQYAAGYRRLKVYSNLSQASYEAIRDEASRLGMTMMGHPPEGVREPGMPKDRPFNLPFETLLDDGFVTLEHMESIVWHGLRNGRDPAAARALARKVAASGTPVDPTLLAFYSLVRTAETGGAYLSRPETRFLNPFIVEQEADGFKRWSGEDAAAARRDLTFFQQATKIFHEEGVLLVAGTDSGIFSNVPGSAMITELTLLTEAGLTPYQALQTATWNPARALGESGQVGRVAPGYRADLILLAGDPLADVTRAGDPDAVILKGRLLAREDLDRLREAAANPPYERTRRNAMAALAAQAG